MSRKKWVLLILGVPVCLSFCVTLPCVQQVRNGEGRVYAMYSLKQIALALQNYEGAYKRLPRAKVTAKDGQPLYSWRVLLLPYLEQDQLYRRFKLDEPWDSPHNKGLSDETPACYLPWPYGRSDPAGTTRYQALTGPRTAFEQPCLPLDPRSFPDGLESTLLVVEAAEGVPWSKPADLVYDPEGPLPKLGTQYSRVVKFLCYEVKRVPGFNAAFADGNVRWFDSDIDEKLLRAMITRNGGEKVVQ